MKIKTALISALSIAVFLGIVYNTSVYASSSSDLSELEGYTESFENKDVPDFEQGMTPTAKPLETTEQTEAQRAQYVENNWMQDFEVHFLVSLPFTALYSYISVFSIDAMVQGQFPPQVHQADTWMVIGAAIGSSLAIALGSINRVPDQTGYQVESTVDFKDETDKKKEIIPTRFELVQIVY